MHGVIFNELRRFIVDNYGIEAFNEIKKEANLQGKFYFTTNSYPDSDLEEIINAACTNLKVERDVVLERFGEYIVEGLVKIYHPYIKPEWDCMDLIEQTEHAMHRAVRTTINEARPPKLEVQRIKPDLINIRYTSERKMAIFGIGILKGIAKAYETKLLIEKEPLENGTLIKVKRVRD